MSEDLVLLELNARWNCDLPFGWVPITGPADNSEELEIYDLDAFIDWFADDAVSRLLEETFGIAAAYEIVEGGAVAFTELAKCVFGYNGLEHVHRCFISASPLFLARILRNSRQQTPDRSNLSGLARL